MRLREIQAALRDTLPHLKLRNDTQPTPGGQPGHGLLNIEEVRTALRKLAEVPGLGAEMGGILDDPLLKLIDGAVVDQNASSSLMQRLHTIERAAARLLDILSH